MCSKEMRYCVLKVLARRKLERQNDQDFRTQDDMLMVPKRPLLTCMVTHHSCTDSWSLLEVDTESDPNSLEVAQVLEAEESRGYGPHGLADRGKIYCQGNTTVIGAVAVVVDMRSWVTKNLILDADRAMKFETPGR